MLCQNRYRSVAAGLKIQPMWRTAAAAAVSLSIVTPGVPAHAAPDNADPSANYSAFLQAIAGDGIVMNGQQAIGEGQAVCRLMRPPGDASLWDAGHKVLSIHPDWGIRKALQFADRSIQDICPQRGSF